jgi:hypothetical protein
MSVLGKDGTRVASGTGMSFGMPGMMAGPRIVPNTTSPVALPIRKLLGELRVSNPASRELRKTPAAPVSSARLGCAVVVQWEGGVAFTSSVEK